MSLGILDYATFYSNNVVDNEARFMLEGPMYNPIRDRSPSLFKNIFLGSFKSFY